MEFENVPQLLIFAPNWLGDAVMSLPAIADVRRALPATAIDVAARPAIAPLFRLVDGVRDLISGDAPRDREYGAALLLRNSFQSALTAWRAGVPERWGFRSDWRGGLLTRAVLPPADTVHQAAYYQHLVRALGFANGALAPSLAASKESRSEGQSLLRSAGWDGRTPLVAIAPGAAYGGAKKWPAASFAELAASLAADGVQSVVVGSASDAATPELRTSLSLVGKTDLPALAGVLVHCRALVSNDSGAMHFASALGIRVVALFGPSDERVTRPLARGGGPEPVVLTHDTWCRPCLLRECPLTHSCMRGIRVEDVRARLGEI
jgi:heptosyltransferase-2